jgi:membrane fusion protein (multidrug efflux system)
VLETSTDEEPDSASAESGGEPDYRLAARQIRVAYRNDGMAGVIEGIETGDRVVTAGQLKLYPGLRVAIVDDVPEYSRNTLE